MRVQYVVQAVKGKPDRPSLRVDYRKITAPHAGGFAHIRNDTPAGALASLPNVTIEKFFKEVNLPDHRDEASIFVWQRLSLIHI